MGERVPLGVLFPLRVLCGLILVLEGWGKLQSGWVHGTALLGMLDEVARVLRPDGVCVFNFSTIDHPQDMRWQLETVREQARRRRFSGATDRAYTRAQLSAMYEAVGLQVLPATDLSAPGPWRVVIAGRRPAGGA